MKHASLFSGIGGFDLAAEMMGWQNIFHCEINEFCQKILKYYWPESILFNDIKNTNFKNYEKKIDILTGGFPCQPYSNAGKRFGKEDDRHLWPEMLRAIREIQPRYVVGENVRGLTNWNGGLVFDEVQIDLEAEGYEVTSFLLPACAINAPHRRDRIWFVAYSPSFRRNKNDRINNGKSNEFNKNGKKSNVTNSNRYGLHKFNSSNEIYTNKTRIETQFNIDKMGSSIDTNSNSTRNNKTQFNTNEKIEKNIKFDNLCFGQNNWERFPVEQPVCYGNDGLSKKLDGITFPKWRKETIKGAGNAIVPQLVLQIFKAINEFEQLNK
jgi:DNA (cytosine-5)-methyltransferase 1